MAYIYIYRQNQALNLEAYDVYYPHKLEIKCQWLAPKFEVTQLQSAEMRHHVV